MLNSNVSIHEFELDDFSNYIEMEKSFYGSGATIMEFDENVVKRNFYEIISKSDFLNGFIINLGNKPAGFVILSFMWSSEMGGKIVFIEELFVSENFRNMGIAYSTINLIVEKYKNCVKRFRLEVCKTNEKAVELYKKFGFNYLNYDQMILDDN